MIEEESGGVFGEESKHYSLDGMQISRKQTTVEREVSARSDAAAGLASDLVSHEEMQKHKISAYMPHTLDQAIFCGHLVTDMDSIAGSIGASELFGGTPSRASEVNSETKFCLEYWGVDKPRPIEEFMESAEYDHCGVCLVDHQQTSQLNKSIPVERIVGVIDHHALQNSTIVTDMPIYIDIRPWGSMSTIIAHSFVMYRRQPRRSTAGMLLCAILSDTLNLQGPTTTEWDRLMAAVLADIAQVQDVQLLASKQFKAKSSELAMLTPIQLVNGDQKVFTFTTEMFEGSVGFSVVETTDDGIIMSRAADLLVALNQDKEDKGLSVLFFAVVNIVELRSSLLMLGPNEQSLARAAFTEGSLVDETRMDLGCLVSRKKDFIPAITRAIKSGWCQAPKGSITKSKSDVFNFDNEADSASVASPVSSPGKSPSDARKGVSFAE